MRKLALLLLLIGIAPQALCARRVTVAQLEQILTQTHGEPDADVAQQLSDLQLTERLSSPKLAMLSAELPGQKSKTALMAIGDVSVFLDPPPEEVPQKPAPDAAEQAQMMSLAMDYLKEIVPKLPDFYARRSITSFEKVWTRKDETGSHKQSTLHTTGKFRATVYYQEGKEVVHHEGAKEHGLITRGTFGPILSTVILDAANGTTEWGRWEEGPSGPMAVFRFRVPQSESHYQATGSREIGIEVHTAYHGEIGLDASSGKILKLMLEADPDLGSSVQRNDIMLEYGSVEIGGRTYTCPVRSVSYSVSALYVVDFATSRRREATRVNDVVFDNYHIFRSEIRILP